MLPRGAANRFLSRKLFGYAAPGGVPSTVGEIPVNRGFETPVAADVTPLSPVTELDGLAVSVSPPCEASSTRTGHSAAAAAKTCPGALDHGVAFQSWAKAAMIVRMALPIAPVSAIILSQGCGIRSPAPSAVHHLRTWRVLRPSRSASRP